MKKWHCWYCGEEAPEGYHLCPACADDWAYDHLPPPDEHGHWTRTEAGGLYYHAHDPASTDD